jgi:hypothetical protein
MFYDAGGRLNVYVTDAARSQQAQTRILTRVNESLRAQERDLPSAANVTILPAVRDYGELTTLRARMDPVLGEPGVVFTDIDESQNRLRIGVLAGTGTEQIQVVLDRLDVPLDAVSIEITEPIEPLATLRDANDPIAGGLQIWRFTPPNIANICTLGFNVRFTNPARSQPYFFTNSHCTEVRGDVTGTQFRQGALSLATRIVAVEVADPPFFTCQFAGFRKVGRTSGWTRGAVTGTCINVGVAGAAPPIAMLCQDRVEAFLARGDSGSPVFEPNGGRKPGTHVGILWGGSASSFVFRAMENIHMEFGGFRVR